MKVETIRAEMTTKYENVEIEKRNSVKPVEEKVDSKPAGAISEEKVNEAVEKINKHLEMSNTTIKFKVHEAKGSFSKVSIKVVDEESEKVIAEIPSEEAIELSERMEKIIGFLFDVSK